LTSAVSHNGGRTQVNFNFTQLGGDFPYINCLKGGSNWSPGSGSAPVSPSILDALGYPTTIVNSGVQTDFYVPSQLSKPGNYVVTWTGNGTISVTAAGLSTVAGSLTSAAGSGRYVFSLTDHHITLAITALGSPAISNLQVFHADDETLLNAGEVFGVKFKQRLVEGKFGVLRFLNWTRTNVSNVTTWATRKTLNHVFYNGMEYRSSLLATSLTYGGLGNSALSVSAPSGWAGLVDKALVHIIFGSNISSPQFGTTTLTSGSANVPWTAHGLSVNNRMAFDPSSSATIPSNITALQKYWIVAVPDVNTVQVSATQGGTAIVMTATSTGTVTVNPVLTLNVGATADVDILSHTSDPLSTRTNSYPLANKIGTFFYDAQLACWIKYGGDTAFGSRGLDNGIPIEDCVRLCAEVGAHPYFTTPTFAQTPMTDYTFQMASYIKANSPGWMVPRIEGSNELWNTAAGFHQTTYANQIAKSYGWGLDYNNWIGKAISTIGQDVAKAYGVAQADVKTQTAYHVICGVQTGLGSSFPGGTSGSNARLSSTQYLLQSPQSGYLASAASNWVTHVCCAQYMTPSAYGQASETTLANAFAGKAFVASITGGVMTVSAINASNSAALAVGDTIFDSGVFACSQLPSGVTIASLGTGAGTTGTYNLSANASGITLSSRNMTAAADLTAVKTYVDTLNSGATGVPLTKLSTWYSSWASYAAFFNCGLCGYEGGYSPDYSNSGGNALVDMLRAAGKQHFDMFGLYTANLNLFAGVGGIFPSEFQFSGSVNVKGYSTDAWSVLEDIYQSPNPPQFEAIRLHNNRKRRMVW
jgi:hypothetical protein